jgi:hypothetical protein
MLSIAGVDLVYLRLSVLLCAADRSGLHPAMSPVYLYAVLAEAPAGPLPSGLSGEPVRLVACDDVWAAVGDVASAPAVDEASLRAHDAAVRRLAAGASRSSPRGSGPRRRRARALRCAAAPPRRLPRRTPRRARLRADDAAVRAARTRRRPRRAASDVADAARPGTRYLDARARVRRRPRAIPEVAACWTRWPLRARRAAERHERPPLLASVYHLVPRESLTSYRPRSRPPRRGGLRVTLSGPGPLRVRPDELA